MLKKSLQIVILILISVTLSSCLLAVAGAGMGGGYYLGKNYTVQKKTTKKTPTISDSASTAK